MNKNFENTALEYELFPGSSYTKKREWNEFNSNSYIAGIMASYSSWGIPINTGADTPGFSKPVPFNVFGKVYPNTQSLVKDWPFGTPDWK